MSARVFRLHFTAWGGGLYYNAPLGDERMWAHMYAQVLVTSLFFWVILSSKRVVWGSRRRLPEQVDTKAARIRRHTQSYFERRKPDGFRNLAL